MKPRRASSGAQVLALALPLLLPILLGACGKPAAPADPLLRVLTVVAQPGGTPLERVLPASVQARHETVLGFRIAGRVLRRQVEVGSLVSRDSVLGELDPADDLLGMQLADDQRRAADIDLAQAERDAARYGRLDAAGALASAEAERQNARSAAAAARRDQAGHQFELAELRNAYTRLRAPFSGVVTQLQFEPGLSVTAGQPVLTLADAAEPEVVADIPVELQQRLAQLHASASLPETPGQMLPLRLREVAAQANPNGRTVRARFTLLRSVHGSASGAAGPGLGRAVDLHLSEVGAAQTVLPAAALVQTAGDPFVYRVDETTHVVVPLPVVVLDFGPDTVRLAGIPPGTRVVAAGVQRLHSGLTVQALERSASGLDLAAPAALPDDRPGGARRESTPPHGPLGARQ